MCTSGVEFKTGPLVPCTMHACACWLGHQHQYCNPLCCCCRFKQSYLLHSSCASSSWLWRCLGASSVGLSQVSFVMVDATAALGTCAWPPGSSCSVFVCTLRLCLPDKLTSVRRLILPCSHVGRSTHALRCGWLCAITVSDCLCQ